MTKIVRNARHGGFSLSDAAVRRYAEIKGVALYPETEMFCGMEIVTYWTVPEEERRRHVLSYQDFHAAPLEQRQASNEYANAHTIGKRRFVRHDPALVQVVEELGAKVNGPHASLEIVEVPSGSRYWINEYDGMESVMTPDDFDWSVAP